MKTSQSTAHNAATERFVLASAAASIRQRMSIASKYFGTVTTDAGDAAFTSPMNGCSRSIAGLWLTSSGSTEIRETNRWRARCGGALLRQGQPLRDGRRSDHHRGRGDCGGDTDSRGDAHGGHLTYETSCLE